MLMMLAGCDVLIGKLPEPDPIWKAVDGFGGYNEKGCRVTLGQPDCSRPEQRIQEYLSKFLPAQSEQFILELEKHDFSCRQDSAQWHCNYSKSRAPAPCVKTMHVRVMVSFPAHAAIAPHDVTYSTAESPDTEYTDNRGCFPL